MSNIKEALKKAIIDSSINDAIDMRRLVASLEASGFVIVPKEATEAMLRDGAARSRDFYSEKGDYPRTKAMWNDAVAARPRITDGGDE